MSDEKLGVSNTNILRMIQTKLIFLLTYTQKGLTHQKQSSYKIVYVQNFVHFSGYVTATIMLWIANSDYVIVQDYFLAE